MGPSATVPRNPIPTSHLHCHASRWGGRHSSMERVQGWGRERERVFRWDKSREEAAAFSRWDALVQPHVIGLHARSHWARSLDCIAGGLARWINLHGITELNLWGSATCKGRKDCSPGLHLFTTTLALAYHYMAYVVMVNSSLAHQPDISFLPALH